MKILFINSQSCKYFLKSMVLKSISSLLTSKKFMWQSTPTQMFTFTDKYLKTTFISTKFQWLLRMWMISTSTVQDLFFLVLHSHIPAFPFTEDILFQVNQFRNQQNIVSLNEKSSKIIYINATFTCRHSHKSPYQQHLSEYQVILVSQRETSKQKGHRVCYVCLQSALALTQGSLPQLSLSSLLPSLHVLYTLASHTPGSAQHKHHVWGWMHTGRSSSHTPFSFFSWARWAQQFAPMLPLGFHPKECHLSVHLDKDSYPLNIQGGATCHTHTSFCLFP